MKKLLLAVTCIISLVLFIIGIYYFGFEVDNEYPLLSDVVNFAIIIPTSGILFVGLLSYLMRCKLKYSLLINTLIYTAILVYTSPYSFKTSIILSLFGCFFGWTYYSISYVFNQ